MRSQVWLPCVLMLGVCAWLIAWQKFPAPAPAPASRATPSNEKPATPDARQDEPARPAVPMVFAPVPDPASQMARLPEVALAGDDAALGEMAVALADPDPQVRAAAREAAVQAGDPAYLPLLETAQVRADDIREKAALQDAVDFLTLPPLELPPPN